ncbi:hypothetical protein TTHERM_00483670 (macronuclear) [Tetrahymena thermophila SB210]|uniref:Uncharacterized protein n=1 Tax=Tetrahymena thermophila (strain SB210) TaxID=312017 RepID=I7MEN1_TETTS|nr:hypothetical protein TTHERM_00483670 [Tetrahymena thermophila SB210]EAR97235.2 hypothetical protein TTHERM_00483670 [Tetrahymena thermophila SB210]|eukprot:XP_001017480.2 hypothetical protein TTHERM_00483670 [Tetrahymena thermophila SB210]
MEIQSNQFHHHHPENPFQSIQDTPNQSDYQKNLMYNMMKDQKEAINLANHSKLITNNQQICNMLSAPIYVQKLKRRSISTNMIKANQQQGCDFGDDHMQNINQNVPSQLISKIKETLNFQHPQAIIRKASTSQIKKRQRVYSYNNLFAAQPKSQLLQNEEKVQIAENNQNQTQKNNIQLNRTTLSASVKNKINIDSIQRDQKVSQQQQQTASELLGEQQYQASQQGSRKLTLRHQVYADVFLKDKKPADQFASNLQQKENEQIYLQKLQYQYVTPQKQQQNNQNQQIQLNEQQEQCQANQFYVKSKINSNFNSNLQKNIISMSRPSSNTKLRSYDIKQKKREDIIDAQDLFKLQNAHQNTSIKERSPNMNPYYYSYKQSRSNSIQTNTEINKIIQYEDNNLNSKSCQGVEYYQKLHEIIMSESILAKLEKPQCRHSYYLEGQDKIKEYTKYIFEAFQNYTLEISKNQNDLGFCSLYLSALQKVFTEINSFISKTVIALPDQIAVDQMKNVKSLLEVIVKMNNPTLKQFLKPTILQLNEEKLKLIQELSLLPTPSTLKFVELFNDIDKYFNIYHDQIDQLQNNIIQQENQIKEINEMLYGAEQTIQIKNQMHQSQFQSNQQYHEKEEMILKLNQSIEQNFTSRISQLKQSEEQNNKELDENKKTINLLNKQIYELKERLKLLSQKKKSEDKSSQINMIIIHPQTKNYTYKLQKYIKDYYPSPFRFSQNCVLAFVNCILCDKIKDDYTSFLAKLPYIPLYKYTALWFMKQFGQKEVASHFLNDFIESLSEMNIKNRQIEFYCSLIGLSKNKLKEEMQNNKGNQGIQACIKSIILQSNLFYQIYYDVASTYRKKLEEKQENYNRPYFFHQYEKNDEISLKSAQQIVSKHLKVFVNDQQELEDYLELFNKIELTQHIYNQTQKQYNFQILKQNIDLVEAKESSQFKQILKKNSGITVPLSNIGQFVIDCVSNIESERLLQFLFALKTQQLEKLNQLLSLEEYKITMLSFYPLNNKAFYENTFACYSLQNVVKIFETTNYDQNIKCLQKFVNFIVDNRTQDSFYAQVEEGQSFQSPRASPHSPKKYKNSNSIKSFSQIKLENVDQNTQNQSSQKIQKSKTLNVKIQSSQANSQTQNFTSKNIESQNELNRSSLSSFEESSPSKLRHIQIVNFMHSQSSPQTPLRQGSQSPKKLIKSQNKTKSGNNSPQKSQKSILSPIRSQQDFFFSTRILFKQEFENKVIDAFFKQHLNTVANIVIIEEVYNNLLNLIKKEQQTDDRIKKIHDSFKYYLQTAKNQNYITTNYITRHSFIQYVISAWDELRLLLNFISLSFTSKQNQVKK